ncbi:MAG: Fe-S protein assembly co-chaperone HscB [Azovibrio sp.]|uniref:Fe-S protein assembly co-chaperone HscB n=1 Tax=Azovibrio sp. TaxID=1872673 RepID=UPI003C791666
MDLNTDFFCLFQLPRAFRIELAELDARYLEIQARVHPDRFAHAGEGERRLSMQWATRANEGYQTLKTPLERAKYLLHLAGYDLQAESNTAMAPEFLMEQMEWRDAVMEARRGGDHHELEHLHHRLRQDLRGRYEELAVLLDDEQDLEAATELVRRLMFLEKLLLEIDDALASLEDGEMDN